MSGTVQIEYNGISFDDPSTKVKVVMEYVKDDADRTVIYQKYTITVRSIVAADNGTDSTLQTIRTLLEEQGKELKLTGVGVGDDLIVNDAARRHYIDVKWGPKPEVLEWEPVGACRAAEISWKVTTCVKMCRYQGSFADSLMSMNYEVDFSLNASGYTTRTIGGYIEVAQTRNQVGRGVPTSADLWRWKIAPVIPEGFARENQNFRLSMDKSRLDFTIVDKQIPSPNAFPPGVVAIDGKHHVGWGRKAGTAKTRNRITVNITLAPNVPQVRAYSVFTAIVRQRIIHSIRNAQDGVLLDSIELEENLFGNQVSFSAGYRVLSPLSDLLAATGLWTPVGNEWTWKYWHQSMSVAHSQRGYAGLAHNIAEDAIVDLCGGDIKWADQPKDIPTGPKKPTIGLKNEKPPVEKSWDKYENVIESDRRRWVARQRILQAPESASGETTEVVDPHDVNGVKYVDPAGTGDVIQQSGRGSYAVRMIGQATRVGYLIPKPAIIRVGNQTAVETHSRCIQHVIGDFLGVPVFSAAWDIGYALQNSPGYVTPLPNYKDYPNG